MTLQSFGFHRQLVHSVRTDFSFCLLLTSPLSLVFYSQTRTFLVVEFFLFIYYAWKLLALPENSLSHQILFISGFLYTLSLKAYY